MCAVKTPRSVSLLRDGLRAVLACAETDFAQCCGFRLRTVLAVSQFWIVQQFFRKSTYGSQFPTDIWDFFWTPYSVKQCEVRLRAVLVSAESLISRISRQKRIFQQSRFSLFIRGPAGEKNVKKSRDTATLKNL